MKILKHPIFIVGAPRSGTTLLTQILSNHPDIFIFNETILYDFFAAHKLDEIEKDEAVKKLYSHLKARVNARLSDFLNNPDDFGCRFSVDEAAAIIGAFESYTNNLSKETSDFIQIFREFMAIIARQKGRNRWGDKTPNHVFHLKQIINDFPDSYIINIVRDPRKFLLSYKFAWRQFGANKGTKNLYHPIITSIIWKRSVQSFLEFSNNRGSNSKCLDLRYEDLTDNIEAIGKKVFDFIEEPFSLALIEVQGSNSSFKQKKESLEPWEIKICEWICKDQMQKYGYKQKFSSPSLWIWMKSIFSLIPFGFKALRIVKKHFKGNIFQYLKARNLFG